MVSARFRRHSRRAAKSFRNNMLSSQGCEVGFHLEVLSFQLVAYIGHLQKEIHPTVQKGCETTSQQKGDFATLWKMLPSTWSDWLAMAVTSSFQLRIAHRLKHWIVYFLRFEMESNASNGVQFGVETKKLWPIEGNYVKLKRNFALTFPGAKIFALTFPDAKIFALTFPNAKIFALTFSNVKM
uniref:Uncharacterized protein n=1 Tax=Vitis vinifera TaxID=29760 RepID=A5AE32_VITVI|nr:hypothetical protein VITISV_023012 [Vitis vinifera]